MPLPRSGCTRAPLLLALLLAAAHPTLAQDPFPGDPVGEKSRLLVGLSLGGTGFIGLVTEVRRGDWGGELVVGTIGFRDLSISTSARHYLGSGALRPVVGAGLWNLTVWSEEEGSGSALILRAPLAVEWNVSGGHHAAVEVGLNRALWIRRLDPEDDRPPSRNIVPFPGFSWRYGN